MSPDLQLEYLGAVLCMMELPSITPFNGPRNRFDDFQALHVALTYGIHWVVRHVSFLRFLISRLSLNHSSLNPGAIPTLPPRFSASIRKDAPGRVRLQRCPALLGLDLGRR
jgi:hypothetical protein